ncbi:flagellar assembly protein FliX [Candidatus Bodocaedibacter vickermanii]|uniref:Class II flagellar assembly regulator n=1 Tax=Candidatus Bodocaedibacter vickermanii TaxID=2741701 RepID=A0A7L9RST6_9PROT|nr:Class II flagellar assembly regulator [Candidatus Paracaedibacteraceae bacterium 'Lake Konstanz']
MLKMIDSLLHSSSLSKLIPLAAKRKKTMSTFDVDGEFGEGAPTEKATSAPIQAPQTIQSLSLLSISNTKNSHTQEIISYGDDLLNQLKTLQYQLLGNEVSHEQLHELETMFQTLPKELQSIPADLRGIVDDIQVRVAVELAKLSINR